jgi:hypothetical protein
MDHSKVGDIVASDITRKMNGMALSGPAWFDPTMAPTSNDAAQAFP